MQLYPSHPSTSVKPVTALPDRLYLLEIDGLRALAVILVLFCHAKFSYFAGGFIGVDVFFVISGYVVCRAIMNDQLESRFKLTGFYTARLKRLAPSLCLMMAATLVFSLLYCFPDNNIALLKNIGFVSLFYSNIYLAKQTGYFDLEAEKHPLLHTWSLSVEEQFYLLIPVLLILIRKLRRPVKIALLATLWSAAFSYSCYKTAHAASGVYYYLPGRIFEFMSGIVLAAALTAPPSKERHGLFDLLLLSGLCVILYCGLSYQANTPMPGWRALWPCLGAVLVIIGARRARIAHRLLSNPGSVFIGRISYVLYLWHWPVIFAFTRLELNTPQWMYAALAMSLLLSVATHYLVEQPLRHIGWGSGKTVTLLMLAPVLFTAGLLTLASHTDSLVKFYPEQYRKDFTDSGRTVFNDERARLCWSKEAVVPEEKCSVGQLSAPRKAVLLGDSHAYHQITFLDQLGKDHGLAIHDMTYTMCAPVEHSPSKAGDPGFQEHAERCRRHGQAVMDYVMADPRISVVFMSAVWDLYHNPAQGAQAEPTGHGYMPGEINQQLAATIARLESAGKRVIFLDDIPILPATMEDCVSNRVYLPGRQADRCTYPRALAMERYKTIDALLSDMSKRFPTSAIIHTYDVPCNETECGAELRGSGLYSHNDRGHLGTGGSAVYYTAYRQRHPGELSDIFSRLP